MRTFFNLLLVLILISCPLRCQLGWSDCCGQAQVAVESMEDCCCDTNRELPPPPVEPVDDCKCICGGATMPPATDFFIDEISQIWAGDGVTPLTSVAIAPGDAMVQSRICAVSVYPCAPNVGRHLCCLHGSLIL
ncbi:MAG: hypothetical protein MK108_10330 [Mariniblastus sp.]|nr:hypothetical protein [Mariniblastus sp.]